jgi:hypothetical protein
MHQSRGIQGHSRPQNTCRTHEQSTQTGNDAIGRPQIASPLPTTIQNQHLVSHQDGFGHHGTEPARSTKSDNDDDGMQKKSENVAHAEDGIRLRKLKNSGRLRNSPPTGNDGRQPPTSAQRLDVEKAHSCQMLSYGIRRQLGLLK